MKAILSLIVLIIYITPLFPKGDSTYTFTPNWKKGQINSIRMQYLHKEHNGSVPEISMYFDYNFIVNDIIYDTLLLELKLKDIVVLSQSLGGNNDYLLEEMRKDLKFSHKIKVNSNGSHFSVLNWEEIYEEVDKFLTEKSPGYDNSGEKYETGKKLMKQKIITDTYKIIFPLLYPYNIEYPVLGNNKTTHYEIIDSDTIVYHEYITILKEEADSVSFNVNIQIDTKNWIKIISLFTDDIEYPEYIQLLNTSNNYIFSFNKTIGKVYYIMQKITTGGQEVITEYFIKYQ
jgi:hypothetical protein